MSDQPLSFFARLALAFRVLFNAELAAQVQAARTGALPAAPSPLQLGERAAEKPEAASRKPEADTSAQALHLLALLQREGRLLDFLEEDLAGFSDANIGAAARTVHDGCRKVLRQAFALEPVRREAEGAPVELPAGFDAAAVRLTGNVVGNPPFKGVLRHHGWRAAEVKLGPPPSAQPSSLLAPAEVELP
jgi:hypothetical protein